MPESTPTDNTSQLSNREQQLYAQRLLQREKVSVGLDDGRSYVEIAQALGILEVQQEVDIITE